VSKSSKVRDKGGDDANSTPLHVHYELGRQREGYVQANTAAKEEEDNNNKRGGKTIYASKRSAKRNERCPRRKPQALQSLPSFFTTSIKSKKGPVGLITETQERQRCGLTNERRGGESLWRIGKTSEGCAGELGTASTKKKRSAKELRSATVSTRKPQRAKREENYLFHVK